jgi:hemerythrin-like domain-containing protein
MTKETSSPSAFFASDHAACDALWAAVEAAAEKKDRAALAAAFATFAAAMRRHFDMEEQVLFPAFEQQTGMTAGPTRVMRSEHAQMRALLEQMAGVVDDGDAVLDHGDTLLMLIQQHNRKEEGVLYPMCDARLGAAWPALAAKLASF